MGGPSNWDFRQHTQAIRALNSEVVPMKQAVCETIPERIDESNIEVAALTIRLIRLEKDYVKLTHAVEYLMNKDKQQEDAKFMDELTRAD